MMTNGTLDKTLKLCRQAEKDVKSMSQDEAIEAMVLAKRLTKELENVSALLEAYAIENNFESKFLLEHEQKFQIKPGNDKTVYDVVKIGTSIPLNKFVEIVNIVDGRAKEILTDDEYKIVEMNKSKIPSEKKIVSISKMTKQELIEAKTV